MRHLSRPAGAGAGTRLGVFGLTGHGLLVVTVLAALPTAQTVLAAALAYDRTGPRHCGLFGRRAGSVKGFEYSAAMKRSDIVWSAKTLDRFLANPPKAMPGTSMTYAGVPDNTERAALIAYLKAANGGAQCAAVK